MARVGVPYEIDWKGNETLSPFCAVRSEDTLDVFREFLYQEDVRTAGALLGPAMRAPVKISSPPPRSRTPALIMLRIRVLVRRLLRMRKERVIDQRSVDRLTSVSDVLEDAGLLRPTVAFGRYRKRPREAA
jgi:hypothetical protein